MPELNILLTANTGKFDSAMSRSAATALAASNQMRTALMANIGALEQQIVTATKAGTATDVYATELKIARDQLAVLDAEIATQNASLTTNAAEQGAAGIAGIGSAAAATETKMKGMSYYFRSAIDAIRYGTGGGGARAAFYALDEAMRGLMASGLNLLKYVLSPIGLAIGALAVGVYILVKRTNEWVDGVRKVQEEFSDTEDKFQDMADSLKQQAENMRDATRAAADYYEWLQKLASSQNDWTQNADEGLRVMQERFQLEQEMARNRVQTEGQRLAAEQGERNKELKLVTSDLTSAQDNYNRSLKVANEAQQKYQDYINARQASQDPIQKAVDRIKKLDDLWKAMPDATRRKIQSLQDIVSGKTALTDIPGTIGIAGNINPGISVAQQRADAKEMLQEVMGEEFNLGGGQYASMDDLNYILMDEAAKAKYNIALQKKLGDAEQNLSTAYQKAKEAHEKDSQDVQKFSQQRKKILDDIQVHSQLDAALAASGARNAGGVGSRQDLTERERIGAQGGAIHSTAKQQLRVAQQQLQVLTKIQYHLSGKSGENGGLVGDYVAGTTFAN